jgi:hypothetical protein
MSSPYLELAKSVLIRQEALTQLEAVVSAVVAGQCVCAYPLNVRQGFRCPVHCGGSGPCSA